MKLAGSALLVFLATMPLVAEVVTTASLVVVNPQTRSMDATGNCSETGGTYALCSDGSSGSSTIGVAETYHVGAVVRFGGYSDGSATARSTETLVITGGTGTGRLTYQFYIDTTEGQMAYFTFGGGGGDCSGSCTKYGTGTVDFTFDVPFTLEIYAETVGASPASGPEQESGSAIAAVGNFTISDSQGNQSMSYLMVTAPSENPSSRISGKAPSAAKPSYHANR